MKLKSLVYESQIFIKSQRSKSLVYERQIFIKSQRSRREEGCRLVRILESSDVLEEYSSNKIMGNGRVEDFHARFKIKKSKLGYHLVETPLQHIPGHLTLQCSRLPLHFLQPHFENLQTSAVTGGMPGHRTVRRLCHYHRLALGHGAAAKLHLQKGGKSHDGTH